ncbi:NAD-dependent epimerase/dehydratase family protein [Roseitranquillus sediminis]|uniref:NAD-dependent epimerase/dehydratase family protein n=1 Tax=Roseitranquillus sediminis TaxID=2809051 RepID=UPI001D0C51FB|nr:NAD-dependent epimerase/dehydratase family protein [Roseitranquillus sediminis]
MEKPVVLITGADGEIGSQLTRRLAERYEVIGLSLDNEKGLDHIIECDLSDDPSVELAMRKIRERAGDRLASVVHLAAYFDFTGEESPLYEEVNEEGTRRLLRALQDFEVEQFVYASTMLVHQPAAPGERIDEDAPLDPGWAYPKSKAATEQVIRDEANGIPYVLLRLAGLYDDRTAVPTLSHQIARIWERHIKSHVYAGDAQAGQAFIHLEDMLDLFERTIDQRDKLGAETVLLAGEPDTMSYEALQDELGRLIHNEDHWRTVTVPKPLARFGAWLETKSEPVVPDALDQGQKPFIRPFMIDLSSDHYALDISRAREALDWEPTHRIAEGLKPLVRALKDDPLGWYEANGILPPPWLKAAARRVEDPEALRESYESRYRAQHRRSLWAHWANAGLGVWLICSPPLLGYDDGWMIASSIVSGALLVVLALLSLSWQMGWARWASAVVGLWVLFAPLVFWTDNTGAYLDGTLVGLLVMAFAVGTRPAVGVSPVALETGPTIPKGWDYSPSDWFQRLPVIILAIVGLLISRYLAAYQLETIPGVWDPFFGSDEPLKNGTEAIITSSVSEAWPVPDAGIGAATYALEIVVGLIGSARRWRTMPWLVVLFGIMIVPLGAVSIFFIVIQPIQIGTYCTLCLIAAAAMLWQIPFSLDELVATYQFLRRRHRAGQPWLRVFFTGDTDEGPDDRRLDDFQRSPRVILREMLTGGMTLPWSLAASMGIGVLLMLSPLVFGWGSGVAATNHIVGALVLTVSVAALAPVARLARFLNALMGVVLIFAPMVAGASLWGLAFSALCGIALIALAIPRGSVNNSYGDWDRLIR